MAPRAIRTAGEVEDYAVRVLSDEPVANPDSFEVRQDAIRVPLDVLANDFPSSTGVLHYRSSRSHRVAAWRLAATS